jgi:hypothetical protein
MTTNDTIPAAPPAEVTNAASRPTTTPDAIVLLEPRIALLNKAIEEAGLDAEDLENLAVIARIAFDAENIWSVGGPPPGHPELHVSALFQGSQADLNDSHVPGDIRAYVAPLSAPSPLAKVWARYELSRVNVGVFGEVRMNQERFVEEQNEEFRDAIERMTVKAGETTAPAVLRCQEIEKMGLDALEPDDEDEEGGEE